MKTTSPSRLRTANVTITVEQKSGERFKALAKNVVVGPNGGV